MWPASTRIISASLILIVPSGSEGEESYEEDEESSITTVSRGCLLNTFLIINIITILMALGCIAAQVHLRDVIGIVVLV